MVQLFRHTLRYCCSHLSIVVLITWDIPLSKLHSLISERCQHISGCSLGLTLRQAGCVLGCKNYRSCQPPHQGCGLADRHQLLLTWSPEGLSQWERSYGYLQGVDWELNPGPGDYKADILPLSYPHTPWPPQHIISDKNVLHVYSDRRCESVNFTLSHKHQNLWKRSIKT